mmetsp:Transcript_8866/g.54567  ORF Transcript_8866/g.54567 Transcript_8866/m.54567 type:complete len:354 (-) Transcript_8866:317-1378(-)
MRIQEKQGQSSERSSSSDAHTKLAFSTNCDGCLISAAMEEPYRSNKEPMIHQFITRRCTVLRSAEHFCFEEFRFQSELQQRWFMDTPRLSFHCLAMLTNPLISPSNPGRRVSFFSRLAILRSILVSLLVLRLELRFCCLASLASSTRRFLSDQACALFNLSFCSRLMDLRRSFGSSNTFWPVARKYAASNATFLAFIFPSSVSLDFSSSSFSATAFSNSSSLECLVFLLRLRFSHSGSGRFTLENWNSVPASFSVPCPSSRSSSKCFLFFSCLEMLWSSFLAAFFALSMVCLFLSFFHWRADCLVLLCCSALRLARSSCILFCSLSRSASNPGSPFLSSSVSSSPVAVGAASS